MLSVKDMVGLTNAECSKILRFKAGQGLFISGDNRLSLKFNPSYTEKLLTFTDDATLEEYARVKEQEEMERKSLEFINSLDKLDSLMYTSTDILKKSADTEFISLEEYTEQIKEVS